MHDYDNASRGLSPCPRDIRTADRSGGASAREDIALHSRERVDDLDRDCARPAFARRKVGIDTRRREPHREILLGINRGRRRWIFAPTSRTVDAEITRQLPAAGEVQHLKSRPCTLILDSRNLYDLYSITRALGRSYVTARIFHAVTARIIRGYLHARAIR